MPGLLDNQVINSDQFEQDIVHVHLDSSPYLLFEQLGHQPLIGHPWIPESKAYHSIAKIPIGDDGTHLIPIDFYEGYLVVYLVCIQRTYNLVSEVKSSN